MATTTSTAAPARDGWVIVGMAIAAASAAVASFTGLRGLALTAGWPGRLAWLLPITIDAYAMTSARVWLAGSSHSRRARRFARANAVGAIAASILGNAAYHAVSVHLLTVSWPIVVLVGAVPAAVLGLTAHLHALRTLERDGVRTEDEQKSAPEDGPEDRPRPPKRRRTRSHTGDELIIAARTADAKYRAAHEGRPITRDALRTAPHRRTTRHRTTAVAGRRTTRHRHPQPRGDHPMTDLTGPLATAASLAGRPVHVWTTADPTPPVETSNRKEAHATA